MFLRLPDGVEEEVDQPPHDYPDPQHQATHHREHNGQQQVYEEGDESPAGKSDDHDDNIEHVRNHPRDQ